MTDEVLPPIAARSDHTVYVGKVKGEERGTNLIDPPLRRNDPYFWLRDDKRQNPEVLEYLKKEKRYFEARTKDLEELKETIYKEHLSHIQETDMSAPYKHGPYFYYYRMFEGKSYAVHCRTPLDATPGDTKREETLLDINVLAEGKTFCDVQAFQPAPPKHDLIAYSVDWEGNEIYDIKFIENTLGVEDTLEHTSGDISWATDACSFFYCTKDEAMRTNKVWRHIVGRPQSEDVCIYTEDNPLFSVSINKSVDGNTFLVYSSSSETSEVHLLDLRQGTEHNALELVCPREKGVRYTVEMYGTDTLIILTNEGGAVNNKIVITTRDNPKNWSQVLVPHSAEFYYVNIGVFEKFMVVEGRSDGLSAIWTMLATEEEGRRRFVSNGSHTLVKEVFDDPIYTVNHIASQMRTYDTDTYRVAYSTLSVPHTVIDINVFTHERATIKVTEVGGGFQSRDYRVERRFAKAPDGTSIPVSLFYHKDLDMSTPQPCMLYGYGSYGINMDPFFNITILPLVDRGVIYAIAHVRGGSEMGREWYEVGAKYLTKRNTFLDFIAVAESLVAAGVTTSSQLACEGGSAGGLLIGAVLNMRPDLFHVAIAAVPFVDVITTMCDPSIPLTTGEWEEWGNPNEYKYFDYMLSYSPIDNIREQPYPHLMVKAGLYDPRVAYWEPAKWVAKLRAHKTDLNDLLLNMDLDSGHFSSCDRYKYLKDNAIQVAFVCKHLKRITRLLK